MADTADIIKVAGAILAAFGGSTVILLAASSWLGKVWAARILEKDRAHYQGQLAELQRKADKELAGIQKEFDLLKQTELRLHSDKLVIYRAAIDIVVSLIVTLQMSREGRLSPEQAVAALDSFEKGRLQLYGYLGMLAPQPVMDAQDALMEYLLEVIHGETTGDWAAMRTRALKLLNEIRIDVGLDKSPIEYRGSR